LDPPVLARKKSTSTDSSSSFLFCFNHDFYLLDKHPCILFIFFACQICDVSFLLVKIAVFPPSLPICWHPRKQPVFFPSPGPKAPLLIPLLCYSSALDPYSFYLAFCRLKMPTALQLLFPGPYPFFNGLASSFVLLLYSCARCPPHCYAKSNGSTH